MRDHIQASGKRDLWKLFQVPLKRTLRISGEKWACMDWVPVSHGEAETSQGIERNLGKQKNYRERAQQQWAVPPPLGTTVNPPALVSTAPSSSLSSQILFHPFGVQQSSWRVRKQVRLEGKQKSTILLAPKSGLTWEKWRISE